MIEQRKDAGIYWKKRKSNTKITIKLQEINQKVLVKGQTIHTKQDIPKQRKEILSTTGRR